MTNLSSPLIKIESGFFTVAEREVKTGAAIYAVVFDAMNEPGKSARVAILCLFEIFEAEQRSIVT